MYRLACLLAGISLLAGCGMVAGSTGSVPAPSMLLRPAAPGAKNVSFKFLIPSGQRAPAPEKRWGYISPGSKSVKIISGGITDADVTPSSLLCHKDLGGRLCVVRNVVAYPNKAIVIKFYDGALNASGHPTGNVLSYGKAVPQLARFVSIFQNGLIDRIGVSVKDATPPSGVTSTTPISMTLYDAAGFVIPQPAPFYTNTHESSLREPKRAAIAFEIEPVTTFNSNNYFSFVKDGRVEKAVALLVDKSAHLGLRYAGRGAREEQLKVIGPGNTVKIDLEPKAGFGSSLEFPSLGPDAKMCSIRLGALWYTEPTLKKIAQYNPQHPGLRREYTIDSGRTPINIACVSAEGSGSEVYVALSGDVLGEFAQGHSTHLEETALPTPNAGLHSVGIQSYPTDNATFTEQLAGKIGIFSRDPLLGPWFEFPVPAGGHPTEILGEWFSDPANNAIGTLVDSSLTVVEYPLPHAGSQPGALASIGQIGSPIWFVELAAARIGTIDVDTHRITEFKTAAPLEHVTAGWDGRIYGTDSDNQVEAISPNGRVTVIGQRSEQLIAIAAGGNADLWALTWSAKGSRLLEIVP